MRALAAVAANVLGLWGDTIAQRRGSIRAAALAVGIFTFWCPKHIEAANIIGGSSASYIISSASGRLVNKTGCIAIGNQRKQPDWVILDSFHILVAAPTRYASDSVVVSRPALEAPVDFLVFITEYVARDKVVDQLTIGRIDETEVNVSPFTPNWQTLNVSYNGRPLPVICNFESNRYSPTAPRSAALMGEPSMNGSSIPEFHKNVWHTCCISLSSDLLSGRDCFAPSSKGCIGASARYNQRNHTEEKGCTLDLSLPIPFSLFTPPMRLFCGAVLFLGGVIFMLWSFYQSTFLRTITGWTIALSGGFIFLWGLFSI